jgi:hypothetical protein
MEETTRNWVDAALSWSKIHESGAHVQYRPRGESSHEFKISKLGMHLVATRKWKDYHSSEVYALNIGIPQVPLHEREDLRRAFVHMLAHEFEKEKIPKTMCDGGLNLKFEHNDCIFKSKWSEEAGLVKFKVKVKRNPRQ